MPDHSFPKTKPAHGLPSVTQSFVGFEHRPSFSSWVRPVQDPWNSSFQESLPSHQPEVTTLLKPLTFHADPLAPLRQRDEQALEAVFDDSQVEEIVSDVCLRLKQLYPEPCWEDSPFDFLQGYV